MMMQDAHLSASASMHIKGGSRVIKILPERLFRQPALPTKRPASITINVDACAGWINTKDGNTVNASDVSHGVFGANTGTDRILKLFKVR
ncbi:hypothetical protein BDZ45DRAFT_740900 [Acephala macrosclerotiorum]|nr:hypothetical protein BDZ45DRAFT_740900 [Acephala macrosclerotiorum]